jgi:hypothetical protein
MRDPGSDGSGRERSPGRSIGPFDDPLRAALAAVTCWIGGERDQGATIAAAAIDRDPLGLLDGFAGLWEVVADVCAEQDLDVSSIVRDVAIGVAMADVEEAP